MSDRMRDLLHETADGIEPADRLDAIRSATSGDRRTGRGWWAAGGVGLVAASVVTALALSTGNTPRSNDAGPADSPSTPSATETFTTRCQRCSSQPNQDTASVVAAYYVGETPDGPRLYREFRTAAGADPFAAAVEALSLAPVDPDYRSLWPTDAIQDVSFDGVGDDGIIAITVDPAYRLRPAGMSETEAGLAVEQAIRTFQAAAQSRAAVQFFGPGNPIDQVLGVPTSEPLAQASDLATLAHVSISDPSEGVLVDNDEPFVVRGVGNSYEGNIVTRVQTFEGRDVIDPQPTIAGWMEDRLYPWRVVLDLSDVPPGDYEVVSQTDDPSGEGRFHTDSRLITVID